MSLQFQPYSNPLAKEEIKQKQWDSLNQSLGQISQDAVRNRNINMEQAIQMPQARRAQTLFDQQQAEWKRQNTPQGQLPGWNQPGQGELTMTQNYGQPSGPQDQNPLSLFNGGSQAPMTQNRGVLDHWDQQYPHLASGRQPVQYAGVPDDLNSAYNDPNLSQRDISEREKRFSTGLDFQKTAAEINKENAAATKDLTEARGGGARGLALSEKEDQFYQKEWDKIEKESNPLTTTGRSGLGMAAKADYNANRALVTLSKPVVTNQEAANVMADIAQIYQGGSPTEYGMSHQGYNTLYQKLTGSLQYLTGNPQDSLPDPIKQRLMGVLKEMKSTNKAVIKQQLDHLERAQPRVIGRFKNEWSGIRQNLENGIAGGPQSNAGNNDPLGIR